MVARIASGSASRSSSPKTSVLVDALGHGLDVHPRALDGALQVVSDVDAPDVVGVQIERLLRLGDLLLDLVAGLLALLG
jgi:hypothetical protein